MNDREMNLAGALVVMIILFFLILSVSVSNQNVRDDARKGVKSVTQKYQSKTDEYNRNTLRLNQEIIRLRSNNDLLLDLVRRGR